MTIINPFITVSEIGAELGITRQRVHQIIKEQNLGHFKSGSMLFVTKSDFNEYAFLRRRRDLATAAGRKETKLIKSAIRDTVCRVCGAYAVKWEGTIACENGHLRGEQ